MYRNARMLALGHRFPLCGKVVYGTLTKDKTVIAGR